jgi:NAD(P)-dependent dehydrogenase (short-subunit alcohol dehydrogenase family)
MRCAGEVVVVTGAGGSIGAAVARALVAEGAAVALTDLAADRLDSRATELTGQGARVVTRAGDASDIAHVSALADAAESLGPVTGLVNVAGLFEIKPFLDTTPQDWLRVLNANLLTTMTTCSVLLPRMTARRRGSVVNFASTGGEAGATRPAASYAAAKGAIIAFTKSLARECGAAGIRVNAISPGPVLGPMLQAPTQEALDTIAASTLVGRIGTPEDIAAGVVYLVSGESAFVTGEILRINGGTLL